MSARPVLAALLAALALLAGCGTGTDAVEPGGEFTFVAPGGQTTILYDPPESRGTLRALSGESLLAPGTTIGLEAFRGRVLVVNVWGSWCGPCRAFAPVFEAASDEHSDIVFGKIDTETEQGLAGAAQIMSIPTLMAFRDGVLVFSQPGALPAAALEQVIAAVRALDMDDVRRQLAAHHPAEDAVLGRHAPRVPHAVSVDSPGDRPAAAARRPRPCARLAVGPGRGPRGGGPAARGRRGAARRGHHRRPAAR